MLHILSWLALLAMYYINYLWSATNVLWDTISDLGVIFPFQFMPPGWTFMIAWNIIFFMLAVYLIISTIKYLKIKQSNNKTIYLFLLSCILNISWISTTAQGMYILSFIIIWLLAYIVYRLLNLYKDDKKSIWRITFGLYFWWISIATFPLSISQVIYKYFPSFVLWDIWSYISIAIAILVVYLSYIKWKNIYALIMWLWAVVWVFVAILS